MNVFHSIPDTSTSSSNSQNRGTLEPILEESDNEDEVGYASETSSSSGSSSNNNSNDDSDDDDSSGGSVVQLAEVNFLPGLLLDIAVDAADTAVEAETLSERDYLCPPKRRRQADGHSVDADYQKKR